MTRPVTTHRVIQFSDQTTAIASTIHLVPFCPSKDEASKIDQAAFVTAQVAQLQELTLASACVFGLLIILGKHCFPRATGSCWKATYRPTVPRIVRSSRELRRSLAAFAGICSEVRLTEAVFANLAKDHNIGTDAEEVQD